MKVIFSVFFSILIFLACNEEPLIIAPNNPNLYYQGRIETNNSAFYKFYWPGTSVSVKTKCKNIFALLSDDIGASYYNVIVDGEVTSIIKPTNIKKRYLVASNLSNGEHTIELFRRTEYPSGTTSFYGFQLSPSAEILKQETPDLQMVFIGNSITTGYANEDYSKNDRPDSIFTNNYMAYGAITARYFNADYQCIARGGIGVMVSWYDLVMPEIYNLVNPNNNNHKFTPAEFKNRIVVVNLGQNDSWIIPNQNYVAYKNRFDRKKVDQEMIIAAYKDFILKVRSFYPKAHIICTLGSMDAVAENSPWPGYISKAVDGLNDPNISTLFFPFLAKETHPMIEDHQIMADLLIKNIKEKGLIK